MRAKAPHSVADMPPKMRLCCEHLCSGATDPVIAARLRIAPATVKIHLAAARKRTHTKTRGELAAWCRHGGHIRRVDVLIPYDTITATGMDGRQVEVMLDSFIAGASQQFPYKILAAAAKVRARLFPARQQAAAPGNAATDQPAGNAGHSASDASSL